MPPYKNPKTLYRLGLRVTESLVDFACKNIEVRHGMYDSESAQAHIAFVREILLNHLPGNVIDDLCEERKDSVVRVLSSRDVRIKLAVYMHRHMQKFSVDTATQESKLPVEDPFWITQLSTLSKLVMLDLHLVCTDEILEVVGRSCPRLEEINIVSRIEQEATNGGSFDLYAGLKLCFFVSDTGLAHLARCLNLRKVTLNKMMRSRYGGRVMTESGVRTLLRSLPKLEYMTYGDLGSVIVNGMEGVERLSLTYVSDLHPHEAHIAAMSSLCPNLQHLSLCMPSRDISTATASAVMRSLAESTLHITVLELQQFPFDADLTDVLEKKGSQLTSLLLRTSQSLTSKQITKLGRLCPNLKNLHLKELGTEGSRDSRQYSPPSCERLFPNLQCLYLSGKGWNPGVVLPICLRNATNLTNLSLLNTSNQEPIDLALEYVFACNAMKNLKAVHFFAGCHVSFRVLKYFLTGCPVLTQLTFWEHPGLNSEEVKELQSEVTRNNLDLKICFLEVD